MLCRFVVVISAARAIPSVLEVLAHLGGIQGGFYCSSAVKMIVNQVAAMVEDKPAAQPRAAINSQRDVILSLNIDIAPVTEELKYSTIA